MAEPLDLEAINTRWLPYQVQATVANDELVAEYVADASKRHGLGNAVFTALPTRDVLDLIHEVKRLRSKLSWTNQPTTAGWYFARVDEPGNIYNVKEGREPAMLYFNGGKGVFNYDNVQRGYDGYDGSDGEHRLADYPGYEWAGPLEAPR